MTPVVRRNVLLLLILLLWSGADAVAQPPPQEPEIWTQFRTGRKAEALAGAEAILASTPNDFTALIVAAKAHQDAGRIDAALPLAERITRLYPGAAIGWELATQLYQEAGRLSDRDAALRQLVATQAASLDRGLRARPFVIRDRIAAFGRVVLVQDHFDTGGPDAVRYVFFLESEMARPRNYLILLTDSQTTANWREVGAVGPGTRVFHLDSHFVGPDGRPGRAMYAAYTNLPDYDAIRAEVLEILLGRKAPMSGQAGGLAVPPSGGK